ncbi:CBS domain-containing protein [Deinococcus cellulosilyticus]|uniref:CBS domain-containing protein n=1 Tax=Deinococcus cellulosilyticus (strain DSM 18568 / NBRC 106333 / KACC 11606 / 5516J-15) TaxID=1223518 RepID=A0A511MYW6_DEIC1|nr:CBS domain-containing protein [Deinococcus cellulosilyticus]GEM45531.1 hypothetical protein DC3_11660 [Deinococcus cellulosilyticus NBRC 106333 = KACC 11606]
MLVRERMTQNPMTVAPSTPALEAAARLKVSRLHVLPVVENGQLVGVLKDRDLEEAAAKRAQEQGDHLPYLVSRFLLQDLKVQDIMAHSTAELSPGMTLPEAARQMLKHGVMGLPVVQNGALVGVITVTDLLGALAEQEKTEQTPQVNA